MIHGTKRNGTAGVGWASMPLRTLAPDGSKGMIKRQCTKEYKIEPIEAFIKTEVLGLSKTQHYPKSVVVQQWFGISADETRRMSFPRRRASVRVGIDLLNSPVHETQMTPIRWKEHAYPLCDRILRPDGSQSPFGSVPMLRSDCLAWCAKHRLPPPRSACIGCPYRTGAEWLDLQKEPTEWQDAVEFDKAIRKCGGMRGDVYVHRDYIPLELVQLDPKDDYPMFACEDGLCGV